MKRINITVFLSFRASYEWHSEGALTSNFFLIHPPKFQTGNDQKICTKVHLSRLQFFRGKSENYRDRLHKLPVTPGTSLKKWIRRV